jgi:hypothetical protein
MKVLNKALSDYQIMKNMTNFKNAEFDMKGARRDVDKNFEFLGVFMRDELLDLKLFRKLKLDKDNAMIINLDDSKGPGIHWVALYFHKSKTTGKMVVRYFDSFGLAIIPEILYFINKKLKTSKFRSLDLPLQHYDYTSKNAFASALCGYYAMAWIVLTYLRIDAGGVFKNGDYGWNKEQLSRILKPY